MDSTPTGGRPEATGSRELYAIAPTLFDANGFELDAAGMAVAASWMAEQGIRDLLLTGSYGEMHSLTDDDRVAVLRSVRKVPQVRSVMACAAVPSTTATVRLARRLVDEGADLVMVSAPMAAEVTTSDVMRHFSIIAEQVPAALVVYNNPVFGLDLTASELEQVVRNPAYRFVKQGTPAISALCASIPAVHEASGGKAKVLAASDLVGLSALFAGADGLTSTNSWAFPDAMLALVRAAGEGAWESGRMVAAALDPYFRLARRLGQPRCVKAAMHLRGLPGAGSVRSPYVPLDGDERAELRAVLEKCDAALAELGVTSR